MPTRKEFQEWLGLFPEDTEIRLATLQYSNTPSIKPELVFIKPDLTEGDNMIGCSYMDYTECSYIDGTSPLYSKRILRLGAATIM